MPTNKKRYWELSICCLSSHPMQTHVRVKAQTTIPARLPKLNNKASSCQLMPPAQQKPGHRSDSAVFREAAMVTSRASGRRRWPFSLKKHNPLATLVTEPCKASARGNMWNANRTQMLLRRWTMNLQVFTTSQTFDRKKNYLSKFRS